MIGFASKLNRPVPAVPTMERLIRNISASQYKSYKMCKRFWAFEKVYGVKKRQMQAHVVGHAMHSIIERYILGKSGSWEGLFPAGWNKGLDTDESTWAQHMIKAGIEKGVFQATPGSLVEFPIAFLTAGHHVDARGLPLLCRADIYLDGTQTRRIASLQSLYDGSPLPADWNALPPFVGFIDHLLLDTKPPLVGDHKTAKNRRYATTVGKLKGDEQVISYSAVPMVLRPDVDLVTCRHNVMLKDGSADPYTVEVPITFEKTMQVWDDIRAAVLDMQAIRVTAPKIDDPSNPFIRANNWYKVRSAIDEGRAQEACSMWGGCPMKDICYGRATAEQVVRRLDSPDPLTLVQKPLPPSPPPHSFGRGFGPPRNPMPFAQPKPVFVLDQDVYVLDPDDATTQYRARITDVTSSPDRVTIAIYPDPDVIPHFASLPATYRITLPKTDISAIPRVLVKVGGYYASLKAAGIAEEVCAWQPLTTPPVAALATPPAGAIPAPTIPPVTTPPVPAVAFQDTGKAVKRPERDEKYGATSAAPVAAVLATPAAPRQNPSLTGPTAAWAQTVAPGQLLIVGPNTGHSFWVREAGKQAVVQDVTMGDGGTIMLAVEIEGGPYPDVDSRRFELPPVVTTTATTVELTTGMTPAAVEDWQEFTVDVGKQIRLRVSYELPLINAVLEAVTAEGITVLGTVYKWNEFKGWTLLKPEDIPGSKEQVKAAKAVEKDQAKAAAIAAIDPITALDKAIEAIQVAIAGKVTKKALEGILPLLQAAKGAPAQGMAIVQPDLNETMAVLNNLRNAIDEMQKLLLKITGM